MDKKVKVYLAGPEVFYQNADELLAKSITLCKKYNLIPLSPVDNDEDKPSENLTKQELASFIFEKNCKLIQQADCIVANLNSFRGFEPDSGTVWECGYAFGLQKPGFAFLDNCTPMASRLKTSVIGNELFCQHGFRVENFDSPLNLMLSSWMTVIQGGLEEALHAVALHFKTI